MRAAAKSFQNLIVWQKAHAFVLKVYSATQIFPKEELYGLTSQFRRAAVSIPANIAEGFRKRTKQDKARFLNISEGLLVSYGEIDVRRASMFLSFFELWAWLAMEECRYYLILAQDLGYLDKRQLWKLTEEIGRLLNSYRSAILTPNS